MERLGSMARKGTESARDGYYCEKRTEKRARSAVAARGHARTGGGLDQRCSGCRLLAARLLPNGARRWLLRGPIGGTRHLALPPGRLRRGPGGRPLPFLRGASACRRRRAPRVSPAAAGTGGAGCGLPPRCRTSGRARGPTSFHPTAHARWRSPHPARKPADLARPLAAACPAEPLWRPGHDNLWS